ncbi:hypothetical protein [uncultured Draconibacterium sp.]|uniref:hypothetical protein n=1 Tax=uncultured Draconibacterium sp. TaxID=1573823 RepID=UPI003217CDE5
MNISGNWTYKEDFEFGNSVGEVKVTQTGNDVSATFTFTEKVENDYEINVIESVKGIINKGKVVLESQKVKATQNGRTIEYIPNNFEVYLVSENKMVGSTYDSENVCGVFIMERINVE